MSKSAQLKVYFLIATILVVPTLPLAPVTKAQTGTITVPDDYSTIQEAINNASHGDTVYVKNGVYIENPIINKKHISPNTLELQDSLTTGDSTNELENINKTKEKKNTRTSKCKIEKLTL